jgi:hypothetical protein
MAPDGHGAGPPAVVRTFRSPPTFLEGAGWLMGGAAGLVIVPSRQVEMYPQLRARTAEAWRKRMHARKPIPLPARLPAIFAVALACSVAADCLVCACEHGVSWEALLATRLGGSTYALGSAAASGAVHSWEFARKLTCVQRADLWRPIRRNGAEAEVTSARGDKGGYFSIPNVLGAPFSTAGRTDIPRGQRHQRPAGITCGERHQRPGLPFRALHSC